MEVTWRGNMSQYTREYKGNSLIFSISPPLEIKIDLIVYSIPINKCQCYKILKCPLNDKILIIYKCNIYYLIILKMKNGKNFIQILKTKKRY